MNAEPGVMETEAEEDTKRETLGSFLFFIFKVVLVVFAFRVLVFSAFSIPSESMMPNLLRGDYLVAAKWPYGFSKHSLPFSSNLPDGRIFARTPERGDIVIFKHPIDGTDYIKRVIGLPGDTIALENGQVVLNGALLPQKNTSDFAIEASPYISCRAALRESNANGAQICSNSQALETMPDGKTYPVLDFGPAPQDNYTTVTVPEGHVFLLGDNRDNSQDSRFAARELGGIGIVPQDLLVGRADFIAFSTDGTAEWLKPWTWFSAARWDRIGNRL